MTPNVQILTRTVAAGGTVRIDVTGSNVLFVSNTGNFNFSLDGNAFQAGFSILGVDVSRDISTLGSVTPAPGVAPQFNAILLQDTSGAANTITFIVSNYPVTFINPNATYFQKNSPTYTKASGTLTVADGALTAAFTGVDAGHTRKLITISNLSANNIYATDAAGNAGVLIPTSQSIALETSGSIKVLNTAGSGASNYSVMEIFYQ